MHPIQRAKDAVGGPSELAKALRVTTRTLNNWQKKGARPKQAREIEYATGVKADEICPEYRFHRDQKGKILRWERIETGMK